MDGGNNGGFNEDKSQEIKEKKEINYEYQNSVDIIWDTFKFFTHFGHLDKNIFDFASAILHDRLNDYSFIYYL